MTMGLSFRLMTLAELRVLLRRPDVIGLSLMMPVLLMLFFGALYSDSHFNCPPPHVPPGPNFPCLKAVNFILPQYAVLAVMSLAFNTIGINVATSRGQLILKRFGGTPLPRWILLVALVISATALIIFVEAVLVALGIIVFGAEIKGNYALVLVLLLIDVLFFSSMGIVSGGLPPPNTVPAANPLIFLALGFLGGVFIPIQQFPSGLANFAKVLPSQRAVDMLQQVATLDHGLNSQIWQDLGVLGIWFVVVAGVGVRFFKWE